MPEGQVEVEIEDYAYAMFGVKGKTANEVSARDHIRVLCAAQKYVDSAVSKTCNVNGEVAGKKKRGTVSFRDFQKLYTQAWKGGAKGCTTFNKNGKRFGIIRDSDEGAACRIDPDTGVKTCEA